MQSVDIGLEAPGFGQIFAGSRGSKLGKPKLIVYWLARLFIIHADNVQDVLPGRALISDRFKERLVVFKIKRLHDAAQQTLAAEVLQLRVEVSRISGRTVDDNRSILAPAHRRIVFEIDLDARVRREDIRLTDLINRYQRRNHQSDADDQPKMLAHRTQVFFEVVLFSAFGIPISLIAVVISVAVRRQPIRIVNVREFDERVLIFHW